MRIGSADKDLCEMRASAREAEALFGILSSVSLTVVASGGVVQLLRPSLGIPVDLLANSY
jgi:hypothetical protein